MESSSKRISQGGCSMVSKLEKMTLYQVSASSLLWVLSLWKYKKP